MSKLKDHIVHLVDDWETHSESFKRTGFWGTFGGAGAIFLAQNTGRLLLTRRSHRVLQPGTWGTVGTLDHGGSPARRVVEREELRARAARTTSLLCLSRYKDTVRVSQLHRTYSRVRA
jgi:hypothetical protein